MRTIPKPCCWGPEHAACSWPLGWPCLFIPRAYTDLGCLRTSPCPSGRCLLTLCCLIHPRHSLVTRLVNSSHPEPLWQVYPPPPLELALRTRGTLMALHRARICSWSCSSLKGKENSPWGCVLGRFPLSAVAFVSVQRSQMCSSKDILLYHMMWIWATLKNLNGVMPEAWKSYTECATGFAQPGHTLCFLLNFRYNENKIRLHISALSWISNSKTLNFVFSKLSLTWY